ncbi:hypothetical protein [Gemmatimonas sp.]|uniref:hypothetical protein n=1 Tax=Gemmatimonas sp. TaxID=1962908 RepID=UPI00333F3480
MAVGLVLVAVLLTVIDGATLRMWEDDPQSRRMREADHDDSRCDDCRSVVAVRELLTRGDACVLLCARCAETEKGMRTAA